MPRSARCLRRPSAGAIRVRESGRPCGSCGRHGGTELKVLLCGPGGPGCDCAMLGRACIGMCPTQHPPPDQRRRGPPTASTSQTAGRRWRRALSRGLPEGLRRSRGPRSPRRAAAAAQASPVWARQERATDRRRRGDRGHSGEQPCVGSVTMPLRWPDPAPRRAERASAKCPRRASGLPWNPESRRASAASRPHFMLGLCLDARMLRGTERRPSVGNTLAEHTARAPLGTHPRAGLEPCTSGS